MESRKENLQSVQATMLVPLWGRAHMSRLYPDVLNDTEAIRIVGNVGESGFNFSAIEKAYGEFGGLSCVVRARHIDARVKAYTEKHPEGTVVNIGAGLDTTFSRVDNGKIRWYNLDLPDAIAYREALIPPSRRSVNIAKSMFDYTWLDDVDVKENESILLVAGGVFYYFEKAQIKELAQKLIARFPHGELFFDAASILGIRVSNRMMRKSGNKDAQMHFFVNNPGSLKTWSLQIHTAEYRAFWGNMASDTRWHFSTRVTMRLCDAGRFAGCFSLLW
jgi:O-methyltransferase involved in polyketide biosynthesis